MEQKIVKKKGTFRSFIYLKSNVPNPDGTFDQINYGSFYNVFYKQNLETIFVYDTKSTH